MREIDTRSIINQNIHSACQGFQDILDNMIKLRNMIFDLLEVVHKNKHRRVKMSHEARTASIEKYTDDLAFIQLNSAANINEYAHATQFVIYRFQTECRDYLNEENKTNLQKLQSTFSDLLRDFNTRVPDPMYKKDTDAEASKTQSWAEWMESTTALRNAIFVNVQNVTAAILTLYDKTSEDVLGEASRHAICTLYRDILSSVLIHNVKCYHAKEQVTKVQSEMLGSTARIFKVLHNIIPEPALSRRIAEGDLAKLIHEAEATKAKPRHDTIGGSINRSASGAGAGAGI
jgi:hypothetical protein